MKSNSFRLAPPVHAFVLLALLSVAAQTARAAGDEPPLENDRRPAQRDDLPADTDRRPPPLAVFDTNHDGIISAEEIAAAPDVLRSLDRNKDGKLTGDELFPRRPKDGRRPAAGGDSGRRPRDGGRDDQS
jgi:hypothetical protein